MGMVRGVRGPGSSQGGQAKSGWAHCSGVGPRA